MPVTAVNSLLTLDRNTDWFSGKDKEKVSEIDFFFSKLLNIDILFFSKLLNIDIV